jgi:hypothetical protein
MSPNFMQQTLQFGNSRLKKRPEMNAFGLGKLDLAPQELRFHSLAT